MFFNDKTWGFFSSLSPLLKRQFLKRHLSFSIIYMLSFFHYVFISPSRDIYVHYAPGVALQFDSKQSLHLIKIKKYLLFLIE